MAHQSERARRSHARPGTYRSDGVFANGVLQYLWRALAQNDVVLDIAVKGSGTSSNQALLQAATQWTALQAATAGHRRIAQLRRAAVQVGSTSSALPGGARYHRRSHSPAPAPHERSSPSTTQSTLPPHLAIGGVRQDEAVLPSLVPTALRSVQHEQVANPDIVGVHASRVPASKRKRLPQRRWPMVGHCSATMAER
jgi:hypothetical protein